MAAVESNVLVGEGGGGGREGGWGGRGRTLLSNLFEVSTSSFSAAEISAGAGITR